MRQEERVGNRNDLIKAYGFVEQITANEDFLKESLDLAAKLTHCDSVYISLIDEQKQYILSQRNSGLSTINATDSICQFTVAERSFLQIEDTRTDARTQDLPMVKDKEVIFYAGSPLKNSDDRVIGALCVMSDQPNQLTDSQAELFSIIGKQVMGTLDQQRSLIRLIKEINSNFKPSQCADINCLQTELTHLQSEVVSQNELIKSQKENLEKLNAELESFAYRVAHDVKAPLKTIGAFTNLLEKEILSNVEGNREKYFALIQSSLSNMDELVSDLLSFARIEKSEEEDHSFSFLSALKIALSNLDNLVRTNNAEVQIPSEDFEVKAHKSQLIVLLQNLISNGIKYQDDQKTPIIKITTKKLAEAVQVSIADNGIGIAEEYFEEIFKPFKRLHKSAYKGTGIGLATCKKIVEQLHSDLSVQSTPGQGSVFSFQLSIEGDAKRAPA